MCLKMIGINLILLFIYLLFFNFPLNPNASPQDECYYSNLKTSESWKIVWQDEFESERLSIRNWKIEDENENDECRINYKSQTNCLRRENVWTNNGLLMMMAKQEKYANRNFTGAMITSEQFFSYGRYEIRAMIPKELNIVTKFETHNDNDQYWTESGQIDLIEIISDSSVNHRGFYPYGSKSISKFIKSYLTLNKHSNSFHRYGVEWDSGKIKFFFDDNYDNTVYFNDTFGVKPWQQLRLQIFVRNETNTVNLKMNWRCPTIVIDYIRVYEKVQLDDSKFNAKVIKSKQCEDKSEIEIQEQEMISNKICSEASHGKKFKSQGKHSKHSSTDNLVEQKNYWVYATISLSILFFVMLAVLVVFLCRVPQMVAKASETPLPRNEFELNEYTEILE